MYRILLLFWEKSTARLKQRRQWKVLLLFCLLYGYSVIGFIYFEHPVKQDLSWLDAMWWALVTMTTVGYGDFFPVTPGGRFLVGLPTMIFGIGFLGYIISEAATRIIEKRSKRLKGMATITSRDHILLINISRLENVLDIVKELKSDRSTKDKEICLIDETLSELPQELANFKARFVKGNPTKDATLLQANIRQASHAIVLSKNPGDPHSDDLNLSITLVMEKLHPDIFTIVQVIDPERIRQIELAGCDSAVCVSEFTTNLVIQELQDPGVKSVIQELTSNRFGLQIYLTPVQQMQTWTYQELVAWGLKNGFTVLGLKRGDRQILNCTPDLSITPSDKVILIGKERPENLSTA